VQAHLAGAAHQAIFPPEQPRRRVGRAFDLIRLIGIERYIQLNSAPASEQE